MNTRFEFLGGGGKNETVCSKEEITSHEASLSSQATRACAAVSFFPRIDAYSRGRDRLFLFSPGQQKDTILHESFKK